MPYAAIISQVLQGIQAAINAWPQVQGIITSAKAMITALFEGKVISAEDQNALHAWVDAIAYMSQKGLIPPAWTVEPDPISAPTTTTTTTTTKPTTIVP